MSVSSGEPEDGITISTSRPIASSMTSGAVFLAENELFDKVLVKETSKSTRKFSVTVKVADGSTLRSVSNGKNETIDFEDYRKDSSASLDPASEPAATTCCSKKTKKYVCNVTVVLSLIVVVCLYSLGIIFFYTDVPKNENFDANAHRNELTLQLEQCLMLLKSKNGMTNQTSSDTCSSYTDNVCLPFLQSVASNYSIDANNNNSIMVQLNPQIGFEPNTVLTVFLNSPMVTEDCRREGLPLLCQLFYLVCDSNNEPVSALGKEQCTAVIEGVCRQAFDFARSLNLFTIPDCENLDSSPGTQIDNNNNNTNTNSTNSTATNDNSNITCHPDFDVRCGRCVPNCNRFSETSEHTQKTIDIFFIIAAVTCVIGGIFVIIVSFLRRSVMFEFPSVFVVYMTIVMMIISVLVLISYGARDHLYCTQPELPLAYENPTLFCQLSGFILHAGVLQIVLYWLLHLIHLFLKFIFPFAIRHIDTKKWKRIFHLTEVILINLLTVIAPTYILVDSKYYPYGYPPVLCIPNATLTFYALVLPIILMLCLGTCIILLMFWRLQMRPGFKISKQMSKISRLLRLTTAEVKVVVLLCFFLTFGVVNAVYFSLYARSYDFVLSLALEYTICQSTGHNNSCEVHKDEIEENRYHGLANASYFLMGLLTISNFLFAVHVKQLKGHVRRLSVKAVSRFRSTVNQSRGGSQSKSRDSS